MPGKNGHSRPLYFTHPPRRVVSLVPSLTESMFDLGLGQAVVGVTDYCIHPREQLANLPRLGGTRNPRVPEILALEPDLVMANWEENTRQTVEELEAHSIAVWVTFPKTVLESLDVLWKLVELFRDQQAQLRLEMLERSLEWTIAAVGDRASLRYFCPIWHEDRQPDPPWWMTFNRYTYCNDLLLLLGGENVFGERERRYPLAADLGLGPPEDSASRDTRYPRLGLDEIRLAQPGLILLPDEPYAFGEEHLAQLRQLLADTPAVRNNRIFLIEGSLITWHGTRLARALRELPSFFS